MGQMYVAAESGALELDGDRIIVHRDHTRVDEGHELLAKYPDFFRPLEAHYRVEAARQEPAVPATPAAPAPAPAPETKKVPVKKS